MGVKVGCNVRAMSSLVSRLFSPPVFDCLQYTEGTLDLVRQTTVVALYVYAEAARHLITHA